MKKSLWNVPKEKQIRIIIDTDANCEGDDQYAIVHALLTPKCEVAGITAEHYGNDRDPDSMEKSYQEVRKILGLLPGAETAVYRGAEGAIGVSLW